MLPAIQLEGTILYAHSQGIHHIQVCPLIPDEGGSTYHVWTVGIPSPDQANMVIIDNCITYKNNCCAKNIYCRVHSETRIGKKRKWPGEQEQMQSEVQELGDKTGRTRKVLGGKGRTKSAGPGWFKQIVHGGWGEVEGENGGSYCKAKRCWTVARAKAWPRQAELCQKQRAQNWDWADSLGKRSRPLSELECKFWLGVRSAGLCPSHNAPLPTLLELWHHATFHILHWLLTFHPSCRAAALACPSWLVTTAQSALAPTEVPQ